jgi:hypothetical protein
MALHYHYQLFSLNHSIPSLGGRWVRPRPIVSVTLIGPKDTRARDALLDSGADDTLFPEKLAADLGIDLTNAPQTTGSGIGGRQVPVRYAQLNLRLSDGIELREWTAWVGFTPGPLSLPVLGFAGCLQFFKATFFGDVEKVELEVNQLYPGT